MLPNQQKGSSVSGVGMVVGGMKLYYVMPDMVTFMQVMHILYYVWIQWA